MTSPAFVRTVESFVPGAHTLPRFHYTSPEVYAEELARIFYDRWVCVGRARQIERPGEFFLAAIGESSLIVVRGNDGAVRTFHNVCRHRGTRLCEENSGTFAASIQCPYHAWTYSLDGRLIGAPHMQDAPGFEKRDYPLHAVATAEWEGFVFAHLGKDPVPFYTWLAPLIGRFARWGLGSLVSLKRMDYDVEANWKLIFLNYSECLHCPVIHPLLSRRSPFTSGANDLVEGPFLGGYMMIGTEGGTMSSSGGACAPRLPTIPGDDAQRAYYYTIFPNLCLSLFPDYAMFHSLWPQSPTRTRVVCEWLFHPAAVGAEGFNPEDAVEFWDITNREDWRITQRSQAGIASPGSTPGPYSPRESLLAAWDREYLRQMGPGAATAGAGKQ